MIKNKKPKIVAVSGGFDPVHIGHVRMFAAAKKLGEKLIVILNNDNWLIKKKGYAFMPELERKEVIEAFRSVDKVVLTKHPKNPKDMSVCESLEAIRPDIFANGGDRKLDNIPEVATCRKINCQMVFNLGRGGKVQSSSWLVDKSKNKQPNKKVILFDFGGVLCKDLFYAKTLLPDYQEAYDWIQKNIFANQELINQWMRGQISINQINEIIASNTGIHIELLQKLFEQSVHLMELEAEMMELAHNLKKSGHKIGIVTDNMEVFKKITVPKHKLDQLFDVIISSIDHGLLKQDENGKLFDMALSSLNETFDNSIMVDDSVSNIQMFQSRGGDGFLYKNTTELKNFLNKKINNHV